MLLWLFKDCGVWEWKLWSLLGKISKIKDWLVRVLVLVGVVVMCFLGKIWYDFYIVFFNLGLMGICKFNIVLG